MWDLSSRLAPVRLQKSPLIRRNSIPPARFELATLGLGNRIGGILPTSTVVNRGDFSRVFPVFFILPLSAKEGWFLTHWLQIGYKPAGGFKSVPGGLTRVLAKAL